MYLRTQDVISRKHFAKWLADSAVDPTPKEIMMTARNLNMETSIRVFCGNHVPEKAAIEISEKYWAITRALELVNFPWALPGTKVYKAIQARKVTNYWLEMAARNSKIAMANGAEAECMIDEWIKALSEPGYNGRKDFSDREIAMVVFSFLFASQDAMSSGLIYGFQHLADHPEILAKVREEQERVRGGNFEKPMTLEMMDQMSYLKAFVKESLRLKPPVTMVGLVLLRHFIIKYLFLSPIRSHTKRPKPSLSPPTTPCLPTVWLFPHFTTPCTIPRSSPIRTSLSPNAGSSLIALLIPTQKATSCSEVVLISVLVLSMRRWRLHLCLRMLAC